MRIEPLALIPFFALSAVASPFFGQNFSAGHFDRLLEARRQLMRFCVVLGVVLAVALSLLIKPLAALFSESAAVLEVAAQYTWLVAWSWGAHGLVMSVNAAFNGSARPAPALVISTARVIVVFLPLALLGRSLFGLPGIFAAAAVSNIALGLVAFAWLGKHIRTAAD